MKTFLVTWIIPEQPAHSYQAVFNSQESKESPFLAP
jgi:hypothetical protein